MLKKLLFSILFTVGITHISADQPKCVRGASQYGFFANFLWAINHLHYCQVTNKIPTIYWVEPFAYYDKNGYNESTNGWEYYFEPVSHERYQHGDSLLTQWYYPETAGFSALCFYAQYISNKHLLTDEEQKSLQPILNHEQIYLSSKFAKQINNKDYPIKYHPYSTAFRKFIKESLLNTYIRIKPSITKSIDTFYDIHIRNKKTIAIHLRGSFIFDNEVLDVPLNYIFEHANKYAQKGVQFFIATDQYPLLEEAKKHLNGPVIYYDCERFATTTSPYGKSKLHPKLGQDILIETLLLSRCDYLIHTLSNVSTTALYFNPDLEHTVIY